MGLADVPKHPKQLQQAEDDLPAQVGSLAPILGEDQEEKEEVLPGLSRCRPPSRVADSGPQAKVSHHLMLPLPSLRLCPPMCGLNPEPILRPNLSPANYSSNPGLLMSRGQPQQKGLADVPLLPEPRGRPQQVGFAEVLPGRLLNLPGPRTSRPRVQPQQMGLADVPRQPLAATDGSTFSSVAPTSGAC